MAFHTQFATSAEIPVCGRIRRTPVRGVVQVPSAIPGPKQTESPESPMVYIRRLSRDLSTGLRVSKFESSPRADGSLTVKMISKFRARGKDLLSDWSLQIYLSTDG